MIDAATNEEIQPTEEQIAAVGHFNTGASVAIEAGAGSGKTSTLRLLAESTNRTGQYLAFSRALVDDARGAFPMNVDCSTAHSLAFRAVGRDFAHRLKAPRMRGYQLAKELGINGPIMVTYGKERKVLQPGYLAGLVMRGVTNFCQSADEAPKAHHLPYVDGIDEPDAKGQRTRRNNDALRRELAPYLVKAWADVTKVDGRLPYSHAHYFKLFERSEPRVRKDFILFDEAQDASPVILSVVEQQPEAQVVWVGDSAQAIFGFTGAVNAFERISVADRLYLTQSFRFGPAIADLANLLLEELDSPLRIRGLDAIDSEIGFLPDARAILCRTNAVAVETVLGQQKAGRSAHLVGGGDEIVAFAKAADRLMDGERVSHHDLACFTSWGEVREYVAQDPQGDELALLVKLVEEYGVETIVAALDGTVAEEKADVVVSTAHKSKGREWPTVRLAGDFPDTDSPEELRLLYVACTRARERLDVTMCGPVQELLHPSASVGLPLPA